MLRLCLVESCRVGRQEGKQELDPALCRFGDWIEGWEFQTGSMKSGSRQKDQIEF